MGICVSSQNPPSLLQRQRQDWWARNLTCHSETPQTFHYLEANDNVPLTNNFKPQVKVLSRKPVIAKRDPVTGLAIDDDGDESKKEVQLSPEEIRAKQKREREEKQRRYEEARAKIFGESNPSSGTSSPGTTTPPRTEGNFTPRGRGRGRGGYRGSNEGRQYDNRPFEARRPANPSSSGRELYDPNHSPKPESTPPQRGVDSASPSKSLTSRDQQQQQQPFRAPRGPDGTGRGGFGFARRGAKED